MLHKKLTSLILGVVCGLGLIGGKLQANCCDPVPCCDQGSVFDGFYAGITGGYVSSVSEYEHFDLLDDQFGFFRSDYGVQGGDIGAYVGWGFTWNSCGFGDWYLGVELVGLGVFANGHHDVEVDIAGEDFFDDHHQKAKMTDSFQIDFRVGMPFCNVLPYFKLGYNNARWEIRHRHFDEADLEISSNHHKRLGGFLAGFGIDFTPDECSNFVIGLEWTFTQFQRESFNIFDEEQQLDIDGIRFRPRYNRVGLRVGYVF